MAVRKRKEKVQGRNKRHLYWGGKSEKKRVTKMERKKVFKSKNVEREEEKQ